MGPRKIRGGKAYDNLDFEKLLSQMSNLDFRSINNRPRYDYRAYEPSHDSPYFPGHHVYDHYRNRRSVDELVIWGPIVCFMSFLIASVFMVGVKGAKTNPKIRNVRTKTKGKNSANENSRSNRDERTMV